jgi:hypothetical protein
MWQRRLRQIRAIQRNHNPFVHGKPPDCRL